MCKECVIGMWNEYNMTKLVTYNELKDYVEEYNEKCKLFNRVWKTTEYKTKTILDYLDKRKSTNLTHFNNCRYCR